MEPQHTGDVLKHLGKQNELLKETHKTMLEELQKLEVEEHIMMNKLCELMTTYRLNKKKMERTQNVSAAKETVKALTNGDEDDRHKHPPVIYTYSRRKKKKSG